MAQRDYLYQTALIRQLGQCFKLGHCIPLASFLEEEPQERGGGGGWGDQMGQTQGSRVKSLT